MQTYRIFVKRLPGAPSVRTACLAVLASLLLCIAPQAASASGGPTFQPAKGESAFPVGVTFAGGSKLRLRIDGEYTCSGGGVGSGDLTSTTHGTLAFKWTGCGNKIRSEGASCGGEVGTIETKELTATLAYVDPEKVGPEGRETGLVLSPASGKTLLEFCNGSGEKFAFDGSFVAVVSPLNQKLSAFNLKVGDQEGWQYPQGYENEHGEWVNHVQPNCTIDGHSLESACYLEIEEPSAIDLAGEEGTIVSAYQPEAVTGHVSQVEPTAAELNGTINPEGDSTTYWFEYGSTESFGSKTAEKVLANTKAGQYPVWETITGLTPGATYYYRIVAHNSGVTTYGKPVMSFTTGGPTLQPLKGNAAFPLSFAVSGGHWKLDASGGEVTCEAMGGSGAFSGVKSGKLTLKLTGCKLGASKCNSAGGSSGEIETKELDSLLAFSYPREFNAEELRETAFVLSPASGEVFAEIKCNAITVVIKGQVVANIHPLVWETGTLSLAIEAKKSASTYEQVPAAYETESGEDITAHPSCEILKIKASCAQEASSPAIKLTGEEAAIEPW